MNRYNRQPIHTGVTLVALLFALITLAVVVWRGFEHALVPDSYTIVLNEQTDYPYWVSGSNQKELASKLIAAGDSYDITVKLAGIIPLKTVTFDLCERINLNVGGAPIGILTYTQGLFINEIYTLSYGGQYYTPAEDAGLQVGDIVRSVNSILVTNKDDFADSVNNCLGVPVLLRIERDGRDFTKTVTPIPNGNGYHLGIELSDNEDLVVRQYINGENSQNNNSAYHDGTYSFTVGTLTYFNPETSAFGGLGHATQHAATKVTMPLESGQILAANIRGVKSVDGYKMLDGIFNIDAVFGEIERNCSTGIYGTLFDDNQIHKGDLLPIAFPHEVELGTAYIYTTLNGNTPERYTIEITKLLYDQELGNYDMEVSATDTRLTSVTGGVVQGMSGSPIIQNGKLVGALWGTSSSDPTRGIGVHIKHMLADANY